MRALLEPGAPEMPFPVDERVLEPRVAGLIAVGGSLTPQWKTRALPVLHTFTFSMQTAVVDQVVFAGAGGGSSSPREPPHRGPAALPELLGFHAAAEGWDGSDPLRPA